MPTKSRRTTIYFSDAFSLPGVDILLPSGEYVIVEDQDLIEGLSFVAYQRVATFIVAPSISANSRLTQMFPIELGDLEIALWHDIVKSGTRAGLDSAT